MEGVADTMKHDNKGAHRPAMHDAPGSITPMTTLFPEPDPAMQEAVGLLRRLEHQYAGDESYDPLRYLGPDRDSAIGDVRLCVAAIRALMERVKRYGFCGLEEKPHELKPDACVGWISYQEVEQMQARIDSLEAERDRERAIARHWKKCVIKWTLDGEPDRLGVDEWPDPSREEIEVELAEIAARVEQKRKKRTL